MIDALTYDVGSYAVFLQAPIKISGNFALIPQFTYTGTRLDSDNKLMVTEVYHLYIIFIILESIILFYIKK